MRRFREDSDPDSHSEPSSRASPTATAGSGQQQQSRSNLAPAPALPVGSVAPVLTSSRSGAVGGAGAAWYATDTVQLTTFRPLASTNHPPPPTSAAAAAPVTVSDAGSGGGILKPIIRNRVVATASAGAHESLDASDYENLSSCTSGGRYATLPPQQSTHHHSFGRGSDNGGSGGTLGRSGGGGGGGGNGGASLYRQHYSTAALTVVGRDDADRVEATGHEPTSLQQTSSSSLHRPTTKRSHWVNHNGRPSDVLARVLQANQDWLDPAIISAAASSSPYEPATASRSSCNNNNNNNSSSSSGSKDNRTSSLRSVRRGQQQQQQQQQSPPPSGGVFQLPSVMGSSSTMPRAGFASTCISDVHGNVSSSSSAAAAAAAMLLPSGAAVHNSLRMLNPSMMGPASSSSLRLQQQQQQQQQQQILPLMSFNSSSFSMPPSILPPPVSATTSCGQLQYLQQQQQQQQHQLLLREREDNYSRYNHQHHLHHHQSSGNMAMGSGGSGGSGQQHNTHAIQLQTSLEMGPVVCPALCEIRTQLQELTRSVESCQTEVSDMKRDMSTMRHEVESVHHFKEDIDDLRDCMDKLQEQNRRRKLRLLEQGLTGFLIYAIFAAVLGMLQFGYNTGVINAPQEAIESFIKRAYSNRYGEKIPDGREKLVFSIAVSIFAIGGMIGGFGGGYVANKFGRKRGLLLNNLTGILGAILMGFSKAAQSYEMLIIGRLIIGFNCGFNTSLVPMYISEIAPLNLRGGLGTVNQLGVTIGILFSQVLGIEEILGTEDGWPVLLGLAVCPAILQLVLFYFCPESPRYLLITANREDEARTAMKRLRASSHIEEDIEDMRVEAQQCEAHMGVLELLKSRALLIPLGIGIVMQLSQQLSGINAVLYYSTELFIGAGLGRESAKYATIGVGTIMVGMTLVSIALMDRTGRRTLHLWGLGGMFIFSIFITISLLVMELIPWVRYVAVVATLTFVLFFAVGPGSIPWMITAELFSQGPRPAAMSLAVLVNWLANFFVGLTFLPLKEALQNYIFLPFSVLLAFFWVFTYKIVPETKNKTFDEISALFRNNDREEFAAQNCILASNDPGIGPLIVPVSTNTPAHTENTALLAETRTIKTNPS